MNFEAPEESLSKYSVRSSTYGGSILGGGAFNGKFYLFNKA